MTWFCPIVPRLQTNFLLRFFDSPPASPEDRDLFRLVLRWMKKRLEVETRSNAAELSWFRAIVFRDSFPLFLQDALAGWSTEDASSASSSSSALALLDFLTHPPSSSDFSWNVMTVGINWLGSGLDLCQAGVVPVVEAVMRLVTRTIAANFHLLLEEPAEMMKEVRIFCFVLIF